MPYIRVVYSKRDPAEIETVIANFREALAAAAWSAAPGYLAAELKLNRETGAAVSITGWETLEALNASDLMAQETRRQAQDATGAIVLDIDRFEIFLRHGSGDLPVLPSFSRFSELYARLDRIEETIEFVRTRFKSTLAMQRGYRALNCVINRMTGRMVVVSTWESVEARAASSQVAISLRLPEKAAQIAGAEGVRDTEYEVAVFHGRTASGEFFEAKGVAGSHRPPIGRSSPTEAFPPNS